MTNALTPSDRPLLERLRGGGGRTVAELAAELGVTATAVRQRLQRLLAGGFIQRSSEPVGRGRPQHRYSLTERGATTAGDNYGDLALALWDELRSVPDVAVRRGLLRRVMERLADRYRKYVSGEAPERRMADVAAIFAERDVPLEVDASGELPVLKALSCPYTGLAEQDRSVCAMERMLFSDLVGQPLRLQDCRLDGATCCTFAIPAVPTEVVR